MMPVQTSPPLSPAESHALQRAFSGAINKDVSIDDARQVPVAGQALVLRENGQDSVMIRGRIPGTPASVSGDGQHLAFPVDRSQIGVVSTLPGPHHRVTTYPLPVVDLCTQAPRDVEYISARHIAVETTWGTFQLLDLDTAAWRPIPLQAFDPERWESRLRDAESALPDLTPGERTFLIDRYGTTVAAAVASPDKRFVLVQLARQAGERENMLIHRSTSQRFSIDASSTPDPARPETAPHWSSDSRFIVLDGDQKIAAPEVPDPWLIGAARDAPSSSGDAPRVIVCDDTVIVGGIEVPRHPSRSGGESNEG